MKIPFRKIRGSKGADERAENLKRRFSKTPGPWSTQTPRYEQRPFESLSKRIDRAKAVRDWLIIIGLIGGICVAIYFGAFFKGWTFGEGVRHIIAAPNCDAARMVGLELARPGQPGYYDRHDADRDGIACEPKPLWKR